MRPFGLALALLAAICLSAPLLAEPRLVKDLRPGTGPDPVSNLFGDGSAMDGMLYFYAGEPAHGTELWRTDGTVAGTLRVADICPGPCGGSGEGGPIVPIDGQIYFAADDGVSGEELWRSDGTPGSERRVRDLCPGPCSSHPRGFQEIDGAVLFTASPGSGMWLWRTDGSRRGTTLLLQSEHSIENLTRIRGRVLFRVVGPSDHMELWSSDGTPEGTVPLAVPFGPGEVLQTGPIPGGDFVYFRTTDALWRTDGTIAGTVRLKTASELARVLSSSSNTTWNGLFFSFLSSGDPFLTSGALIRSDGTPGGTFPVASDLPGFSSPVALSSWLVFSDRVGFDEPRSLWRTRGTLETTEKFFELPSDSLISAITAIGDRAIFKLHIFDSGASEVWVTDGTAAGTRRLEGISANDGYDDLSSSGALAFFVTGTSYDNLELWRTDGTEAGTYPVVGLGELPVSSGPIAQTAFDGRLVFSATLAPFDGFLFSSDGSPAGTQQLSRDEIWVTDFTLMAGRLFLGGPSYGLWKTNGTPGGTVRVSSGSGLPLAVFRGQLFFAGGSYPELWRSDGRGATLVKDINPYLDYTDYPYKLCVPEPSWPERGLVIGDRLVFTAYDGVTGRELWATDGTKAGTRLVRDINSKPDSSGLGSLCDERPAPSLSSDPQELVPVRHGALFTADDGRTGREIWWTDGTHQGTHRVVDLRRGAQGSMPHDLVAFRGKVYFIASDDGVGEKLWRTDGTAAGTVMVDDLRIGGTPSWARELTVSRGRLFLAVYNELKGAELWTSRGEAGTTRLVVDLRPGAPGSYPQALTDIEGVLVFAADDGTTGLEPWRSDGTAAGTVPLGDINPGRDASSPGPFTRAGDDVFTGAFDAEHGRELRAIPLQDVVPLP